MAETKSLRIGVMLENVQFTDVMGIDLLSNLSTDLVDPLISLWPAFAPLRHHAMNMTFYFLSQTLEPAPMSPGLKFVPNMTYDDCPRDLDIIIIGGPMPSHRPASADKFLKEAWEKTPVFLTTCVGSMWLASAGVMEGLKATTNRGCLNLAQQSHPEVEWLDQRWVIESKPCSAPGGKGELWTAGGAGCGRLLFSI